MLGHCFAAEAARNRTNGCTHDGTYRASSERASRCTSSNAAGRCSKADSNWVGARRASDRVKIRPTLSCVVIVHVVLRCAVKEEATVSGRVGNVCTVPHANEGVTTPVKGPFKEDAFVQLKIARAKTARIKAMMPTAEMNRRETRMRTLPGDRGAARNRASSGATEARRGG
jgi:hypothetical protein